MAIIKSLLIANRGEIACRIIRTAQALKLKTIAVYSDVDHQALHVQMANQAYLLGPAPAAKSYLNMSKILEIAKTAGADAIHPGYGFLSENAEFSRACTEQNITFIGPPAEVTEIMGSKAKAKQIARLANVPVVPGYDSEDQSKEVLLKAAQNIGFPLLIKATAGGGGKGMRLVTHEATFLEDLGTCQREALAYFKNDKVVLEKYLMDVRHIEVQIFADTKGNVVHLFERDCSLQRRHQKILESSPALGLDNKWLQKLYESAVTIAKTVQYVGAGTIEFLVDKNNDYYFLEMNTRLQVEHPVTEMITGLDLVAWQIQVAEGRALPLKQSDIKRNGYAMEARIYAEDPEHGFLPCSGTIEQIIIPTPRNKSDKSVRLEIGIQNKDNITIYYDALLAKLIVWDNTYELMCNKLKDTLDNFHILGITTNLKFLRNLIQLPIIQEGIITTHFLDMAHPNTPFPDTRKSDPFNEEEASSPWNQTDNWRLNSRQPSTKKPYTYIPSNLESTDTPETELAHINNALLSPMPGVVTQVFVKLGQAVKAGDRLMTIEAMKMEYAISAPYAGKLTVLNYAIGDTVAAGAEVCVIDNNETPGITG